MEQIDLNKIKYYPDRFYICLDGFDTDNLTSFLTDFEIGPQQAIFIHEYYHYLTNISSYPAIRQFALNFVDRFKTVTILNFKEGLNAFPLNSNLLKNCTDEIKYWESVSEIINEDDLDYKLVEEVQIHSNAKFTIKSISILANPKDFIVEGQYITGARNYVEIQIDGLLNISSFILTFGAIDEFLSSSIDEYLFENDFSDINPTSLSQRPFYPYGFFDELLSYYEIKRPSAFEKILIAYYALNSSSPAVTLIEILTGIKDNGYPEFQSDPEKYLLDRLFEIPNYDEVLHYIEHFAELCFEQARIHISQAIKYYYDKFYSAQKFRENDFFYFIRPFFQKETDTLRRKQQFLLALARIINQFTPPVILKDKEFKSIDKLTTFSESTLHIIALYEIFESLKTNSIVTRPKYLKEKYTFPGEQGDFGNLATYKPPPIKGVFQMALNEVGLYGTYAKAFEATKSE